MRRIYEVRADKETGTPYAHVDHHDMWNLVEYLGIQRAAVTYSYLEEYFVVRFLHVDCATAQALLDDWAHADECECESTVTPVTQ